MSAAPVSRRTAVVLVVMVALYFGVQWLGLSEIGLTDDDDFYVPAGLRYAEWLGHFLSGDSSAWSKTGIDQAFSLNHEHPPVAKFVLGISAYVFGSLGIMNGARMGTVLFSTMLAACMLWWSVLYLGSKRGLFAGGVGVLFLLLTPRFYFHSHAGTLDVPVSAMVFATVFFAVHGARSTTSALFCGVVFGLACGTKLNAPFLIVPYVAFLWLVGSGQRRSDSETGRLRLPLSLLSMVFVGPLVFMGTWPWLWFDSLNRVWGYLRFHLHHYGIHFLYFGRVFTETPFAPWHAPWVMAMVSIPLAVSLFALYGLWFGKTVVGVRLRFHEGPDDDVRLEGDFVLNLALQAFFSVGLVAFSGGPKYGGIKLFLPFVPFWCLLAGYGALLCYEFFCELWASRVIPVGLIVLGGISALALQLRFGGYALSQYNALAGGLRGATALGFERQYYDIAFPDLVTWLGEEAPPNTRIYFLPNHWEYQRTYRWYRRCGELRPDIGLAAREEDADWIVLSHERRFLRYGEDLERLRRQTVLREKRIDGVPIWSVLKKERRPSRR